jgi:hypothetical protein
MGAMMEMKLRVFPAVHHQPEQNAFMAGFAGWRDRTGRETS